ncbi:MAG: hypothetical protein KGJ02_07390, partial [Verrucomicrobiota bacterium]|nr:hypothetical protein [Verrucomicrobiota bacterium]
FRRFFGLFWPIFDSKMGGHIDTGILPPIFESKIGSKEPENRLKLFIRIGSCTEPAGQNQRKLPLIYFGLSK